MIVTIAIVSAAGIGAMIGLLIGWKYSLGREDRIKLAMLEDKSSKDYDMISALRDYREQLIADRDKLFVSLQKLEEAITEGSTPRIPNLTSQLVLLWEKRRFRNTIEKNRARIREVIEALPYEYIEIELTIDGRMSTYYGPRIRKLWEGESARKYIGKYNGPPAEVADEIVTFLETDETFNGTSHCDPILVVDLKVTVCTEQIPPPKIITVKVPTPVVEIVEREVPVPVYIVVERDGRATAQLEAPAAAPALALPEDLEDRIRAIVEIETETALQRRRP